MKRILIILLLVFLVGCGKKTYKITLSENLSLVDTTINLEKVSDNKELEIQIHVPEGKTFESILINGSEKELQISDNFTFKVTVKEQLNIEVTFIDTYITSISFLESDHFSFDINEFRLSDITFKAVDSNNEEFNLPLKREYLSLSDFLKLFVLGNHEITINYGNKELKAYIEITTTLPELVQDIIVYSIVDGNTHKFYVIGGFVSYELNITQNLTGEGTFLNQAGGILEYSYDRKTVTIIHTFGALKTGHHEVFHIRFDKEIDLTINLENCKFYNYDEELIELQNIKYYQR